jgi:hypothetical protein
LEKELYGLLQFDLVGYRSNYKFSKPTLQKQGEAKQELGDYKMPWRTWIKSMFLYQMIYAFCQCKEKPNQIHDCQGFSKNLNGVDVLQPLHDVLTLKVQGEGKRQFGDYKGTLEDLNKVVLNDYQGALQDLNMANDFEDNASILERRGEVKHMLRDYEGSLEDFATVDVILPNNVMTL